MNMKYDTAGQRAATGSNQHQPAGQREATDVAAPVAVPALKVGEVYAGIGLGSDLVYRHLILLPGDVQIDSIEAAEEFVTSMGGELPTHAELEHLCKQMRDHFRPSLYCTREYKDCDGDLGGLLFDFASDAEKIRRNGARHIRARAVRRVPAALTDAQVAHEETVHYVGGVARATPNTTCSLEDALTALSVVQIACRLIDERTAAATSVTEADLSFHAGEMRGIASMANAMSAALSAQRASKRE
jgi:hypothetical protein